MTGANLIKQIESQLRRRWEAVRGHAQFEELVMQRTRSTYRQDGFQGHYYTYQSVETPDGRFAFHVPMLKDGRAAVRTPDIFGMRELGPSHPDAAQTIRLLAINSIKYEFAREVLPEDAWDAFISHAVNQGCISAADDDSPAREFQHDYGEEPQIPFGDELVIDGPQ